MRDLTTGKRSTAWSARKDERAGVEQFYKARGYKPLWTSNGVANAQAKAAIEYLAQVDTVGLDPRDYPVPDFAPRKRPRHSPTAELRLTNSVLTYARQAQIGRIHYSARRCTTSNSSSTRRSRPRC